MPMDRRLYPANWNEISRSRREQAGNKCEWCGVVNHSIILRRPRSKEYLVFDAKTGGYQMPDGTPIKGSEEPGWVDPRQCHIRVVLTVAHLGAPHPDGTPGNRQDKLDVRPENLAVLCQRCHLNYDRPDNIAKRQVTFRLKGIRRRREHDIEIGQARMFD
jgi:hypothetical protein